MANPSLYIYNHTHLQDPPSPLAAYVLNGWPHIYLYKTKGPLRNLLPITFRLVIEADPPLPIRSLFIIFDIIYEKYIKAGHVWLYIYTQLHHFMSIQILSPRALFEANTWFFACVRLLVPFWKGCTISLKILFPTALLIYHLCGSLVAVLQGCSISYYFTFFIP